MSSNGSSWTNSIEVLSLEVDGEQLWVGIRHPGHIGAVVQIDRPTGTVIAEFDDIDIPARMAIGFGALWITDSGSDLVYRIGPIPTAEPSASDGPCCALKQTERRV